MGRRVAVLVDATRSAGPHSIAWHATDDAGGKVSSGMYLYRFTAKPMSGGKVIVKSGKLMYTK
jgi:flagellar hook assembly protein FlgD